MLRLSRGRDDRFLANLRTEADRLGAGWYVVLAAAVRPHDSTAWANRQRRGEGTLPAIENRLRTATKTGLATHPGRLARHGHLNLIGALAAEVGRPGGPRGRWGLTPANGQHPLPTLAGPPVPITTATQHTRRTAARLRHEHRANSRTAV